MVWDHEAVGSSPTTPTNSKETGSGQDESAAGHFMSRTGNQQGNLETAQDTGCTSPVNPPPSCGQFQSTTAAQSGRSEHNQSTTADELPVELRLVVESWDTLPEVVRAAIVGMVKGAVKAK